MICRFQRPLATADVDQWRKTCSEHVKFEMPIMYIHGEISVANLIYICSLHGGRGKSEMEIMKLSSCKWYLQSHRRITLVREVLRGKGIRVR